MKRIIRYSQISTSLAVLSNQKLKQIVAAGKTMHEGIGGKSALISINDVTIVLTQQLHLLTNISRPQKSI